MAALSSDLAQLLERELWGFERELGLFPNQDGLWRTVPGVANSAGNLVLHVTGNLQHFVGAVLGGTAYVRDRKTEFGRRSGTKDELVSDIRRAIQIVHDVLPALPDDRLNDIYPKLPPGVPPMSTRLFLLHLSTHAAYHLGQVGYLRRTITGENKVSGALALESLV